MWIYVKISCKSFCKSIWPYIESRFSLSWCISRWQMKISRKCKLFFEKAILPELLLKSFSKPTITNARSPGKVCYCNMSEEDDDLIGCDNKNCQIKWFHLKCLRITKIPKGRWFCPECRKAKKQKNNCSWIHVWFIIHWHFFHISKVLVFIANKYMFLLYIYIYIYMIVK